MANGLACPRCSARNAETIDSRTNGTGAYTRRRKLCGTCGHRWSTYEMAGTKPPREIQETLGIADEALQGIADELSRAREAIRWR